MPDQTLKQLQKLPAAQVYRSRWLFRKEPPKDLQEAAVCLANLQDILLAPAREKVLFPFVFRPKHHEELSPLP